MQEEELCNIAFPMCICRLTLTWISSENSTTHEECWLILTGLPSLRLDPVSSDWSICCLVSTGHSRYPSPTPSVGSFFQLYSRVPFLLTVASRSRAQAFVWFRVITDKGVECLADHPHSVTLRHRRKRVQTSTAPRCSFSDFLERY